MSEEALMNGHCRVLASALTWPVEKSKLLYQGGSISVLHDLKHIRINHHIMGILSSATQRGGSAFLMFQLQGWFTKFTSNTTCSIHIDQALAGIMAGTITAPFHTYWELIKIRGTRLPCRHAYMVSLRPMIARHAVFDGTFFYVNSILQSDERTQHAGIRFAISAATASLTNLIFDVWKTKQMKATISTTAITRALPLRQVLATMTISQFFKNYIVKGFDLSINWYAVGCIKEFLFSTTATTTATTTTTTTTTK